MDQKDGEEMNTTEKLDYLAELKSEADVLAMDKKNLLDGILTEHQRQAIADIEAEFSPKVAALNEQIGAVTEQIKVDVLTDGVTVKGSLLMAVWAKGRTTWDSKTLEALVQQYPSIQRARKDGEPSVSLRTVK